ncbi:MAG: class I SAM-dependent methyltransferase [Cephaloticoccus sp.]|nr:class I SAM-dependent methyltransferase [Cephaloticoccus sp.]
MSAPKPVDDGWDQSADAWMRLVAKGDPNRVYLLDDLMLGLCGDVKGMTVIDVGCGEGRFCRMLAKRGARVTGIDPTAKLIAEARRRQPDAVFHEARAEALPVADASMDLVVSYLSLLDIPDYKTAISEMKRVLRPGGRCIIANQNGFATASTKYWARDEDNNKLHWTMDNYSTERALKSEWAGIAITNWHRPLSAYLQAFLVGGFTLEYFDEPVPKAHVPAAPDLFSTNRRIPLFCTMVWRAPI